MNQDAPDDNAQGAQPDEGTGYSYGNYQSSQENNQYAYGNRQYKPRNYEQNPNYHVEEEDTSVMSMGDWLITILLMMIPCVGIIVYFVWAFGKNGNVNRRNYCRAYLIYWGISMVLSVIVTIIVVTFFAAAGGAYYS